MIWVVILFFLLLLKLFVLWTYVNILWTPSHHPGSLRRDWEIQFLNIFPIHHFWTWIFCPELCRLCAAYSVSCSELSLPLSLGINKLKCQQDCSLVLQSLYQKLTATYSLKFWHTLDMQAKISQPHHNIWCHLMSHHTFDVPSYFDGSLYIIFLMSRQYSFDVISISSILIITLFVFIFLTVDIVDIRHNGIIFSWIIHVNLK